VTATEWNIYMQGPPSGGQVPLPMNIPPAELHVARGSPGPDTQSVPTVVEAVQQAPGLAGGAVHPPVAASQTVPGAPGDPPTPRQASVVVAHEHRLTPSVQQTRVVRVVVVVLVAVVVVGATGAQSNFGAVGVTARPN
jgi:hypothetical protein